MTAPDGTQPRLAAAPAGASAGPASIRIQRRVEWSDTDSSGAWHNTAAFRFMEAAETSLLARLGFIRDVYGRHPRVHIEADFVHPLWFHDLVDISIAVADVGRTSATYSVEIRRGDEVCATGRLVTVLLDEIGGTPQPWPDAFRTKLLEAGPQRPELLVEG
jgi:acyl-CoA thioester hydrolase